VHFDGCVNVGVEQAAKFLQRAVGAKDDGIVGPKTLVKVAGATAGEGVRAVIQTLLQLRHVFYKKLAANDLTQRKFLDGWLHRLVALEQWAQEAQRKSVC
jgi:lysozyme family protein